MHRACPEHRADDASQSLAGLKIVGELVLGHAQFDGNLRGWFPVGECLEDLAEAVGFVATLRSYRPASWGQPFGGNAEPGHSRIVAKPAAQRGTAAAGYKRQRVGFV